LSLQIRHEIVNHITRYRDQCVGAGVWGLLRFNPDALQSVRWHCGVRVGGKTLLIRRHSSLRHCAQAIIVAGLTTAALVLSVASASAQNGFFESLFGRRWNGPTAYADPSSQFNPFGSRETQRVETGIAYCVRLCDGRFFPIQRHSGVTPAQACSSFCPASQTKIYNGSSIENASGPDGKRYADLGTAFVYRDKIVPGCTCNGKDAFGLVNTPIDEDPTLHPGDIVATNGGLMAYNGSNAGNGGNAGAKKHAGNFTPISSYSGLSADLRRKLTETKIEPATETPVTPAQIKQGAAPPADTTASIRGGRNKRAQADR
jgi:Protein of unknown function (DUF2865)